MNRYKLHIHLHIDIDTEIDGREDSIETNIHWIVCADTSTSVLDFSLELQKTPSFVFVMEWCGKGVTG